MKFSRSLLLFCVCILSFPIISVTWVSAAELTGKITGTKGDTVYIEMAAQELPRQGDLGTIILDLDGEVFEAGKIEVIEATGNMVTARTTKGSPDLIGLKVLIQTKGPHKLKASADIQSTGNSDPVDYVFEREGTEFQSRGKVFWMPGIIVRLKSEHLALKQSSDMYCLLKDNSQFSRPLQDVTPNGSLLQFHHDAVKRRVARFKEDGAKTRLVWQDIKIHGINLFFYVSQIISTREIPQLTPEEFAKWFPDKKYVKRPPTIERTQFFEIAFPSPPVTPPKGSISSGLSWKMTFEKVYDPGEKFEPEKAEIILLDVLKTTSVELSKKFTNPWKQ